MPKSDALKQKPSRFRATTSRGIKADSPIDRTGGDKGAGIIRGMAVVSRGEALGHGHWIDADFLQETADAINTDPAGVKVRFTHPELSADGMGKFLGRVKDAQLDGDTVRADLHFSPTAHDAPDGDLAEYVMALAEDDPQAFGTSIVFLRDRQAETEFMMEHGAIVDKWGYVDTSGFKSPDPDNKENMPHVRLAELLADDVVDEPAANPNGLFHRGHEFAAEADAVLSYALGITESPPQVAAFGVDPDRAAQFVDRFLEQHGLTIARKGEAMAEETIVNQEQVTETPAETVVERPAETPVEQSAADPRAELKRFMAAFGAANGAEWFAEGLSYEDAKDKHIAALTARVESAEKKLSAVDRGAEEPATFQTADNAPPKHSKYAGNLPDGTARFAASIRKAGDLN